jgi:hypothetical protein
MERRARSIRVSAQSVWRAPSAAGVGGPARVPPGVAVREELFRRAGSLDPTQKFVVGNRFLQYGENARLRRTRTEPVSSCRQEYRRRLVAASAQMMEQLDAGHAGHGQIQEQTTCVAAVPALEKYCCRSKVFDDEPTGLQKHTGGIANGIVIVDDVHQSGFAFGHAAVRWRRCAAGFRRYRWAGLPGIRSFTYADCFGAPHRTGPARSDRRCRDRKWDPIVLTLESNYAASAVNFEELGIIERTVAVIPNVAARARGTPVIGLLKNCSWLGPPPSRRTLFAFVSACMQLDSSASAKPFRQQQNFEGGNRSMTQFCGGHDSKPRT